MNPKAEFVFWFIPLVTVTALFEQNFLSQYNGFGFPLTFVEPHSGTPFNQVSFLPLLIDLLVAALLITGTLATLNSWGQGHEANSARHGNTMSISLKAFIAFCTSTGVAIGLWHRLDGLMFPLRTGVILFSVASTCFAVIDWIGGLWSLASQRVFASSTQED